MYLWVIIATFIAAIFALMTPIRSDMKEIYVEPQAQSVVTKLYVQHRAARRFLMNNRLSMTAGELTTNDLQGYLPYGFNAQSGLTRFTSLVYCLNRHDRTGGSLPAACAPAPDAEPGAAPIANCCTAQGARAYLISFGCVPMKWLDVRTNKPSAMLLNSMKDTLGFLNGMGYVDLKTAALTQTEITVYQSDDSRLITDMGIVGQGNKYYIAIPQYIIYNQLAGVGNRSFSNVCGPGTKPTYNPASPPDDMIEYLQSCDYCLVYMTPF